MKNIIIACLLVLPFLSNGAMRSEDHGCCAKKKTTGTCTGSAYCTACRNCSKCHYCVGGRICGVCAAKLKVTPTPALTESRSGNATSTQCKAITRKGTQCSRSARSGGYCWQHGG